MSGLVGIFRRDGELASADSLMEAVGAIVHRGPDASGVWLKQSIGLGHCMLWTTPESEHEPFPFEDPESGLVITSDARIDNRTELIESLRLRKPHDEITDSSLILEAYKKWGEESPAHLVGDFAFAIWDRRNDKIFCARDAMGVKSFYYFLSDKVFVFASEIKAINRFPEVPRRLNEVRVLDHLVNLFEDRTITFYKDILRLPPAMTLSVGRYQ